MWTSKRKTGRVPVNLRASVLNDYIRNPNDTLVFSSHHWTLTLSLACYLLLLLVCNFASKRENLRNGRNEDEVCDGVFDGSFSMHGESVGSRSTSSKSHIGCICFLRAYRICFLHRSCICSSLLSSSNLLTCPTSLNDCFVY